MVKNVQKVTQKTVTGLLVDTNCPFSFYTTVLRQFLELCFNIKNYHYFSLVFVWIHARPNVCFMIYSVFLICKIPVQMSYYVRYAYAIWQWMVCKRSFSSLWKEMSYYFQWRHYRDSVTRFSTIFLHKRLYLSPIRTGKNGFVNFFVFAQVDKNDSKSCDSVPLTKVIYCDHLHLNTI